MKGPDEAAGKVPARQAGPEIRLGQLVTSRAGRDTGRAYLVVGRSPDGKVLVADGRYRPVGRAKAKNPRHLRVHDRVADEVARRLQRGEPVSDGQISQALAGLLGQPGEQGPG